MGVEHAPGRRITAVNLGVDKEGRGLNLPLAFDHVSVRVNDEQIACLHLRPMKTLRVDQKPIRRTWDDQAEVIADALTQAEPVCPAQYGREINACLPNGFGIHNAPHNVRMPRYFHHTTNDQ